MVIAKLEFEELYTDKDKKILQAITEAFETLMHIHVRAGFKQEPSKYDNSIIVFTHNSQHPELTKWKSLGITDQKRSVVYMPRNLDALLVSWYSDILSHEMSHLFLETIRPKRKANDLLHYALNAGWVFTFPIFSNKERISITMPDLAKIGYYENDLLDNIEKGNVPRGRYPYWSKKAREN